MTKKTIDTSSGQFLHRFYTKSRTLRLTADEVEELRRGAESGDIHSRYGYGRWLYYYNPYDGAIQEAERHFFETREELPDSMAAYSQMLRFGETRATHPPLIDIEQSQTLLEQAIARGSECGEAIKARQRIYGNWCAAQPQEVAREIEERLASRPDIDPIWHCLLAFAYEQTDREEEAIAYYEKAIELGETDAYGYLAFTYQARGNTALYEEYMEEGCREGCPLCFIYQADTEEEDYESLPEAEQERLHRAVDFRLRRGLAMGEGLCAYYLWYLHHNGQLGFQQDEAKALASLHRGVQLGDTCCMAEIEAPTTYERDKLRLQAVRYAPNDRESLLALGRADDPAFLLEYKEEIEKYWLPKIENCEFRISNFESTPIEPSVIIIWPTGHLEIVEADVYKMKTYRKMGEELIGANGLDALHYSPILSDVGRIAGLKLSLAMYVDREGCAKGLPDNTVGTMLSCQESEIRGPIIIAQEDPYHDCHSFSTLEDLTNTYREICRRFSGLIIVKDEEDGKYDAYA